MDLQLHNPCGFLLPESMKGLQDFINMSLPRKEVDEKSEGEKKSHDTIDPELIFRPYEFNFEVNITGAKLIVVENVRFVVFHDLREFFFYSPMTN